MDISTVWNNILAVKSPELVIWTVADGPERLAKVIGYDLKGSNSEFKTALFDELVLRGYTLNRLTVLDAKRVDAAVRKRIYRERKRRRTIDPSLLCEGLVGGVGSANRRAAIVLPEAVLLECFMDLPAKTTLVLKLRYVGSFRPREIAAITGFSQYKVRQHLELGRRILHRILTRNED